MGKRPAENYNRGENIEERKKSDLVASNPRLSKIGGIGEKLTGNVILAIEFLVGTLGMVALKNSQVA